VNGAPTPVFLAWSGGKDSALALAELRDDPCYAVTCLLTTVSTAFDRVAIHGVRRSILAAQALALGLPLVEAPLPAGSDNAAYDAAWASALERAKAVVGPASTVAYGDLFLEDVRAYREAQARRLGLAPVFPLWNRDTRALAERFIDAGYEAWLVCVDTTQLPAGFAGRRFDRVLLAELPTSVDPCGERGEFHTCVVDGPGFAAPIPVRLGERVRREERFEYCDLVPCGPGRPA